MILGLALSLPATGCYTSLKASGAMEGSRHWVAHLIPPHADAGWLRTLYTLFQILEADVGNMGKQQ